MYNTKMGFIERKLDNEKTWISCNMNAFHDSFNTDDFVGRVNKNWT
jgi:hypothetical protein